MSRRTFHVLDEASIINPATGKPWPLWTGDLPQEPDPHCVCGAWWVDDQCVAQNTLYGASWEYTEAVRALGRAVAAALTPALRWVAEKGRRVLRAGDGR